VQVKGACCLHRRSSLHFTSEKEEEVEKKNG
jgi:hypothetical protein